MRRKQTQNFIVGGALISALFITKTSAYDQEFTHPALTDEIVDFYNLNFPQKLSNQDKTWIIKGSIDEDHSIRPMSHFYDPVHNIGVYGFPTSKQWAISSGGQSNLALSNNSIAESAGLFKSADDFSYPRAMDDYAQGNRQRAMIGFGHLLHLLEDAGVPDHTRNDPHPPVGTFGSQYEHEMAKWNPGNFNIAPELKKEGLKPVILPNLGEYFDKIAMYSNGNFFSKDTISNEVYAKPNTKISRKFNINGDERLFLVGKDEDEQEFKLAFVKTSLNKNKLKIDAITLKNEEIGSTILDGYWDRLSKEVVVNGAGALRLFLDEAEAARQEYLAKVEQKKPSLWAQLFGLIGMGDQTLTTSDGEAPSDVNGDSGVTPTPKVTNQRVSPTPLVTKTPVTNVTIVSPTPSPSKTPVPTPKPSTTPITSTAKKSGRVVINEIAWAGTEASATDEWLELYNTENSPIDISSWQLVSSDDSPDIIFQEGTIIQANSYFLIERTDDNTVSDIMADLAVSFGQGGLNNTGEMVRLFDSAGTAVDVVGGAGEAWYFGDSNSKNSMERIDPMKAGNIDSNWKNFSGTPVNKDATGGGLVFGTPKAKNSAAVQIVVSMGSGGGSSSSAPTPTPTPTSSPSVTPSPTPSPSPEPDGDTANLGDVLINEITWMGTASSANDEWIELYNTTNQTINLTGWTLKAQDETPDITFSGSISPLGFFLLERTSDGTLSSVHADQIYTGALGNGGEHLVLKDIAGTIINQIDGSNQWKINGNDEIIGNNDTKETAQRMQSGWITAQPTPKSQNSANAVVQNPSAVTNLVATVNSPLTVLWSAPNPGSYNTASLSYDLRYSTVVFSEAASTSWWSAASQVASSSLPSVGEKGASESASFDVAHEYGQTLYFALKTKVINTTTSDVVSPQSNVATVSFPAAIDANAWSMPGKDQYHTSFTVNVTGPGVGATISWGFNAVGIVGQPVADGDSNTYFGATDGSSHKLIKLNKDGAKQWEHGTNVSIGTPAVLSDGTVYFGKINDGGVPLTALNSDGTEKWTYDDASRVNYITVSSKGEPHFTYSSGAQNKLTVLNTADGSVKTAISGSGLSGFAPVVLDNGNIIAARRVSGNQFFTGYSADGTQLWDLAYAGANGSTQSNPSYDKTTGKTYSAVGHDGATSFGFRMFVIPSGGSVLNTTVIDPVSNGSGATMVSITPTNLLVGLDFSWANPASGSKLFSLNKSNLAINWFFQAEGRINQQIAVDKNDNAYFSTQSGHIYSVDSDEHERWHISTGINSNISPVLTENGIIWGYGGRVVLIK